MEFYAVFSGGARRIPFDISGDEFRGIRGETLMHSPESRLTERLIRELVVMGQVDPQPGILYFPVEERGGYGIAVDETESISLRHGFRTEGEAEFSFEEISGFISLSEATRAMVQVLRRLPRRARLNPVETARRVISLHCAGESIDRHHTLSFLIPEGYPADTTIHFVDRLTAMPLVMEGVIIGTRFVYKSPVGLYRIPLFVPYDVSFERLVRADGPMGRLMHRPESPYAPWPKPVDIPDDSRAEMCACDVLRRLGIRVASD